MSKKCKICRSDNLLNINIKNKFYFKCIKCEYISLDNKYYIDEESEKKRYLLHNNSINDPGYVRMFENFIKECIIPFKQKESSLLDFGCGPEPVLGKVISKLGFNADLYDKYFYSDNSYKKNKYDIITCTEVIEHLSDPLLVFDELYNLLNNNGIISGMTLFHENNEELFKKWWYIQDTTHISFYSKVTIRFISEIFSFKLLYIDNKNKFVLKK